MTAPVYPNQNPNLYAAQQMAAGLQQYRMQSDFQRYAGAIAPMFTELGTDQGKQFAEVLAQNPRAAYEIASQFGGFKELYALMQSGANNQKLARAAENLPPGSPRRAASFTHSSE